MGIELAGVCSGQQGSGIPNLCPQEARPVEAGRLSGEWPRLGGVQGVACPWGSQICKLLFSLTF